MAAIVNKGPLMRRYRICSNCGYDRKEVFIEKCPECGCTWWRRDRKK